MLAGKRLHLSPLGATPDFRQKLQDALGAAGVRCDIVAGYTHLAPNSEVATEVPVIEFQIAYVESLARIAAQFGASVVRSSLRTRSKGRTCRHSGRAAWRMSAKCAIARRNPA